MLEIVIQNKRKLNAIEMGLLSVPATVCVHGRLASVCVHGRLACDLLYLFNQSFILFNYHLVYIL